MKRKFVFLVGDIAPQYKDSWMSRTALSSDISYRLGTAPSYGMDQGHNLVIHPVWGCIPVEHRLELNLTPLICKNMTLMH